MKDPVSVNVTEDSENTAVSGKGGGKKEADAEVETGVKQAQAVSASDGAEKVERFAVPEKLQQHMVVVPSKLRLVCLAAFILAKCKVCVCLQL